MKYLVSRIQTVLVDAEDEDAAEFKAMHLDSWDTEDYDVEIAELIPTTVGEA